MCFSASASFGTGAALAIAGAISIRKAAKPSHIPFAAIPLLFGLQQITEGFVWLSLDHGSYEKIPIYLFLFVAQVLWPLWVPLSVWLMEPNKKRKKFLLATSYGGLVTSGLLLYFLLSHPVSAGVKDHHILYRLHAPHLLLAIPYFLCTTVTCFLSSYSTVRWLALAVLASFLTSKLYFREELISVWCFFAALISASILFIMHRMRKEYSPIGK